MKLLVWWLCVKIEFLKLFFRKLKKYLSLKLIGFRVVTFDNCHFIFRSNQFRSVFGIEAFAHSIEPISIFCRVPWTNRNGYYCCQLISFGGIISAQRASIQITNSMRFFSFNQFLIAFQRKMMSMQLHRINYDSNNPLLKRLVISINLNNSS